jgi:hypothetical protein
MALRKSFLIRTFQLVVLVAASLTTQAQPATRLMLYDLEDKGNTYGIANAQVVDSAFVAEGIPSPDKEELYYLKNTKAGSEVLVYDFATKTRKSLVLSGNKLAQIRITPDHKFISAFRDAGDSQAIVKFPITGGEPVTVVAGLTIENYTWLDDNSLLLVEPGTPNSLHLMTLRPKKKVQVAVNVGYTLVRSEAQRSFAFVHKLSVDSWSIKVLSSDGNINIAAETLPESDIFTMLSNGDFLMVSEGNLFCLKDKSRFWKEVTQEELAGEIIQIRADEAGKKVVLIAKDVADQ